jgi:hypothetical protein
MPYIREQAQHVTDGKALAFKLLYSITLLLLPSDELDRRKNGMKK